PKELICETVADNGEAICRPVPDKTLEKVGEYTAKSAWTLHVTRNLVTLDRTKKWLKGIAGEVFAQKAAPTAFRAIKSSQARNSIVAAWLVGGGVYLYEKIHGDSESEAKYRLRGYLSKDGSLQKAQ